MKRFLQKSYSWLATLLCVVAFAVCAKASAQGIEVPFGEGTKDGVSYHAASGDWATFCTLWGNNGPSDYYGNLKLSCATKAIETVELYCEATDEYSPLDEGMSGIIENDNKKGSLSISGNVVKWTGNATSLCFTSSSVSVNIVKCLVYLSDEEIAKECTIDVDHYGDNCKPGKYEGTLSKYITLYMQARTATTSWTGGDNCPEGVTFTDEAGQQLPVSQFNYWSGNDQIGVVLAEEVSTPGVYTLHIPEGLVVFESGKFNKEISASWTVVEPDLRPTKEYVFDFAGSDTYTNDGVTSYTQDGISLEISENKYNGTANGFRIGTGSWLTFTAPEKTTIKRIQLLQESSYGVSPDFSANVGEVSVYDKTLSWSGDDVTVTLTDNYGTCYFTKAIVTLAHEELPVEAEEAAYVAWKTLVMTDMKAVKEEWGEYPEADVAGKKPAVVVKAVMEYYDNINWLFGPMGFGDNWAAAKDYYANYETTIEANYAEALQIWQAYVEAELVDEVEDPAYTEPVLSAEDVSAEVAYYIYTDVRGGLTVSDAGATQLVGTAEEGVGQEVDPTDVRQQFAFVNWNDNLYLYSLATEKFIGKANRGNFTDEPIDPIYFKNAGEGTVMLYFDDDFNINLGGSKQVTIDDWKKKDDGNSFIIKVAEKFDQSAILEKLAGGGEVVDPADPADLSIFAGEWRFKGEGVYCNSPENIDGWLNPSSEYTVNVAVDNGQISLTGLIGTVYDEPNAFIGTYDAEAETLSFSTPYFGCYVVNERYEFYTNFQPLVFNVVKDEAGNVSLVNNSGWDFMYEDWYYSQYACGYASCTMTRDEQEPIVEPEPTEWNGEIILPESAETIDDLLSYTVEFEEAAEVKAAGTDVLGAIFEENGNPYAIVLANGTFDVFGSVSFNGSKANVEFVKIADLKADLQEAAVASAKRIGAFATDGKASVVFAGKSFKVDGLLVDDIIAHDYDTNSGALTGIDTVENADNATIYDLSGRRVANTKGGLYIINGRKVYMK